MGGKKIAGIVLIVVGIIILILSLILDLIGIGGTTGFGFYQIGGTIAGAIMAIGGAFLMFKK